MEQAVQTSPERNDRSWLDERLAFEQSPTNAIQFQSQPSKWHPVLIKYRDQLSLAAEEWGKRKRDKDAERLRNPMKKQDEPNFDRPGFLGYFDETGMLFARHKATAFKVSIVTYKRALAIANTILFSAESRGCTVGYDKLSDRLTIRLEDAELLIAIRERQSFQTVNGPYGAEKKYEQTDKIAIAVDKRCGGHFELVDKSTVPVESQLNELFIRLYKSVVVARTESRLQSAKDELRKIENDAYEKITQQRTIEAKTKAEEKESRDMLAQEADRWQQAQKIRAYAAQISAMDGASQNQKTRAWVDWATRVADEMDPSISRHEELLKT